MTSAKTFDHHSALPWSAKLHIFGESPKEFLLDVESGRILHLPVERGNAVRSALRLQDHERAELIALGAGAIIARPVRPAPTTIPLRALSLSVSQKCNLGCTY